MSKRLPFFSNCVAWPEDRFHVDVLRDIQSAGETISFEEFRDRVSPEFLAVLSNQLGYVPCQKLQLETDWAVSFDKVPNFEIVFVTHSAIEYVFAEPAELERFQAHMAGEIVDERPQGAWSYQKDPDGMYHYRDDRGELLFSTPMVSILVETHADETATMHRHGSPALVEAYFTAVTKRLAEAGYDVDGYRIITGPFPVDELNRCVNNSGYIATFLKKLKAAELPAINPGDLFQGLGDIDQER